MSIHALLKLDGITGESIIQSHTDEIDIIGMQWGNENKSNNHKGRGAGAGKAMVGDIAITKKVDAASPTIMLACVTGKHIPKATLTMCKAGGANPLDFYIIDLESVFITQHSNVVQGDELMETLSLSFRQVTVRYQKQDTVSGQALGGSIDARFDVVALA